MLRAQLAGAQTRLPKPGRKPLQPTNPLSNPPTKNQIIKKENNLHRPIDERNKENPHCAVLIEPSIDGSLAEELRAMRERKERMRVERERTEGVMRERGLILEKKIVEMRERGEVQRLLEMEVDRLFRLREIKLQCKRNSPIRSLRQKEQGAGKLKEGQPQTSFTNYQICEGKNSESTSECNSRSQLQYLSSENTDT